MTEETRRTRAAVAAEANTKIEALYEEISRIEDQISEIRSGIPVELPDDREWRLSQLNPTQRSLVELTEKMFREAVKREIAHCEQTLVDIGFMEGPQWKIGTNLKIKLPESYSVTTPPKEPR
jgi:hypothetical protein